MKKQSLSISVPEPCHENWSEMTPVEQGRHCQSCQKTVVDFTSMPKLKIAEYVNKNQGHMCGRFTSDQLNVELIPPKPTKSWLKYAAIFLGLVPTIGYGQQVSKKSDPIPTQINSNHLLGEPIEIEIPITGDIEVHEFQTQIASNIISGIVLDGKTGEPILFGTVALYKNGVLITGVETDLDGRFSIPNDGDFIEASYIGYKSKKIKIADIQKGKDIVIRLKEEVINCPMYIVGIMIQERNDKVEDCGIEKREIEKIEPLQNIEQTKVESKESKKVQHLKPKQLVDRVIPPEIIQHNLPVTEIIEYLEPNIELDKSGGSSITGIIAQEEKREQKDEDQKDETMHFLLPTVELRSLRVEVVKGEIVGSITRGVEATEETWLEWVWRNFTTLVKGSHDAAVENREERSIESITSDTTNKKQDAVVNIPTEEKSTIETGLDKLEINVYPNPTSGMVTIEIPEHISKYTLNVSNVNNQLVYTKTYFENINSLDLSTLVSGSYIISIIHEDKLIHSKMIVKL